MFINCCLDLISTMCLYQKLAVLLCKHLTWDPGDCIFRPNIIRSVYSQGNGLDQIIMPWRLDAYKTKKLRRGRDRQRWRTYTWNRLCSHASATFPFSRREGVCATATQAHLFKQCHAGKQRWVTKSCRGSQRGHEWTESYWVTAAESAILLL